MDEKEKVDVGMVTDILTDAESAFVATSKGAFFHGNEAEILTCLSMGIMKLIEQDVSPKAIMAAVKLATTMAEIFGDIDKEDEKEEE